MPYFSSDFSELGATKAKAPKAVKAKTVKPKKVTLTKTKAPSLASLKGVNAPGVSSTTVVKLGGSGSGSTYALKPITNNVGAPPPLTIVSTNTGGSKLGGLMGLASQVLAGILPHPTVQTADGQVPIYNTPNNQTSYGGQLQQQQQYIGAQADYSPVDYPAGGAGANVGESVGSGIDGIFQWASNNLGIVAACGLGAYLLMRQPPKYGNR